MSCHILTVFHKKGFALSLALEVRVFWTQKRPIAFQWISTGNYFVLFGFNNYIGLNSPKWIDYKKIDKQK